MSEETKVKYAKPIPLKTIDNAPYWDAADQHELTLQKCNSCQSYTHPPGPSCSNCGSKTLFGKIKAVIFKGKFTLMSYRIDPFYQDSKMIFH